MSLNLIIAVEQEDHNNVVRPMILTRFLSGITHSAAIHRGDEIHFDGLACSIGTTIHKFGHGDIAPVSEVYGQFHRPLSDMEIQRLQQFGFRDLTGDEAR